MKRNSSTKIRNENSLANDVGDETIPAWKVCCAIVWVTKSEQRTINRNRRIPCRECLTRIHLIFLVNREDAGGREGWLIVDTEWGLMGMSLRSATHKKFWVDSAGFLKVNEFERQLCSQVVVFILWKIYVPYLYYIWRDVEYQEKKNDYSNQHNTSLLD